MSIQINNHSCIFICKLKQSVSQDFSNSNLSSDEPKADLHLSIDHVSIHPKTQVHSLFSPTNNSIISEQHPGKEFQSNN